MLQLRRSEPKQERCQCGQGNATRLTGVVLDNDVPCGIYYVLFTDHHPEQHVAAIVSIGEFGEGSTPEDRTAFAFAIRRGYKSAEVILKDATQSLWSHVDLLGTKLTLEEAQQHPRLQEVFAIADRIILDDPPVLKYLAQKPTCASCK